LSVALTWLPNLGSLPNLVSLPEGLPTLSFLALFTSSPYTFLRIVHRGAEGAERQRRRGAVVQREGERERGREIGREGGWDGGREG
jgi:hypothetical protein